MPPSSRTLPANQACREAPPVWATMPAAVSTRGAHLDDRVLALAILGVARADVAIPFDTGVVYFTSRPTFSLGAQARCPSEIAFREWPARQRRVFAFLVFWVAHVFGAHVLVVALDHQSIGTLSGLRIADIRGARVVVVAIDAIAG